MNKKISLNIFLVVISVLQFSSLCFAEENKNLEQKTITQLQTSFKMDNTQKALINSITNNNIKKLVLNRDLLSKHNDIFNLEIDVKGITNQKSTGRCWMFAALNLMRPKVIEKFKLDSFEFSQNYLFFWDKLEKANYFLETIIETRDRDIDDRELQALLNTPIPDGGWWNYAVNLIEKYGVIPKELMTETENSNNSRMINKTMNNLARQNAVELRKMGREGKTVKSLREYKLEMLKDYYRLLVLHFGIPPQKFTWRVKDKDGHLIENKYTPNEFYDDVVGHDLNKYVTICDYPSFPYNDHYKINFCSNMTEKPDMNFINLDIEQLKAYSLASLKDSTPVWFGADVGWQMEGDHGIMAADIYDYESLFNIYDKMNKADRIRYRASVANHAMVFVGADINNEKALKYHVENSWGDEKGNEGYWTMYDSWFDKYVFTVIIDKKFIEKKDLKLLEKKPKKIPSWDPLRISFLIN
jgi:bleomycin hydrolase